jgi:hypothetical protein
LTRIVEAKVADARVSRELVGRDKCQLKLNSKYLFIAAITNYKLFRWQKSNLSLLLPEKKEI